MVSNLRLIRSFGPLKLVELLWWDWIKAEVNISSYPATEVAGLFFFCRAEILNSGGFVQKYSDQGVSCKNIGQ